MFSLKSEHDSHTNSCSFRHDLPTKELQRKKVKECLAPELDSNKKNYFNKTKKVSIKNKI